jgi:hypothetical protein
VERDPVGSHKFVIDEVRMENSPTKHSAAPGLTVVLAILMGLCITLAAATLVIKQTLLNYDLHMQMIQNQQIDQQLAEILPGFLLEQLTGNAAPTIADILADPANGFATELIPANWTKEMLQLSVRSFIDGIESGKLDFALKLNLRPIKQQITNNAFSLTTAIINLMPDCTADQLLNFAKEAITGQSTTLPFCRPGEPFIRLMPGIVENWITGLVSQIPPEYDIPLISISDTASQSPLVRALRVIQAVMPYRVVFLAASLILLVILLGVNRNSLAAGIRWVGLSFLIASFLLVILMALSKFVTGNLAVPGTGSSTVDTQVSQMAIEYVDALLVKLMTMLIKGAGSLCGGGLLLLMLTRRGRFTWQD